MTIIAKDKGGSDFALVPADLHSAVCDMIVDLGLQPGDIFPDRKQVYIRWQIPEERITFIKDGENTTGPMVIGSFYTLSLHKKSNLRRDLENWRGRPFTAAELEGFDLCQILGKACMLQVQHRKKENGDVRAFVSSVSKVHKSATPAVLEGDGLLYDDDEHVANFDKLPEWLQKKVDAAIPEGPVEIELDLSTSTVQDVDDDEPPF